MARPRSFDQDDVLRIARDQFWATGYAAARIDEIATATGLGKGSLYGAFGDKHQLFLRVFDDYCTGITEATRQALDGPDEGALTRLRDYVLRAAAGSDLRGCLLAKGVAELAGQDEAVTARARATFQALKDQLTSTIAAAQRVGELTSDAKPADLAALLLAVLRGIEALGKGGTSSEELRIITKTALRVLPVAQ